ncbi:hypothetical protein BDF14DRAFT_1878402 [Spinellus fusiger]|nr:hypothetical protein BDF14DRAFT_1878402 [Spinellus fusiger]
MTAHSLHPFQDYLNTDGLQKLEEELNKLNSLRAQRRALTAHLPRTISAPSLFTAVQSTVLENKHHRPTAESTTTPLSPRIPQKDLQRSKSLANISQYIEPAKKLPPLQTRSLSLSEQTPLSTTAEKDSSSPKKDMSFHREANTNVKVRINSNSSYEILSPLNCQPQPQPNTHEDYWQERRSLSPAQKKMYISTSPDSIGYDERDKVLDKSTHAILNQKQKIPKKKSEIGLANISHTLEQLKKSMSDSRHNTENDSKVTYRRSEYDKAIHRTRGKVLSVITALESSSSDPDTSYFQFISHGKATVAMGINSVVAPTNLEVPLDARKPSFWLVERMKEREFPRSSSPVGSDTSSLYSSYTQESISERTPDTPNDYTPRALPSTPLDIPSKPIVPKFHRLILRRDTFDMKSNYCPELSPHLSEFSEDLDDMVEMLCSPISSKRCLKKVSFSPIITTIPCYLENDDASTHESLESKPFKSTLFNCHGKYKC